MLVFHGQNLFKIVTGKKIVNCTFKKNFFITFDVIADGIQIGKIKWINKNVNQLQSVSSVFSMDALLELK